APPPGQNFGDIGNSDSWAQSLSPAADQAFTQMNQAEYGQALPMSGGNEYLDYRGMPADTIMGEGAYVPPSAGWGEGLSAQAGFNDISLGGSSDWNPVSAPAENYNSQMAGEFTQPASIDASLGAGGYNPLTGFDASGNFGGNGPMVMGGSSNFADS